MRHRLETSGLTSGDTSSLADYYFYLDGVRIGHTSNNGAPEGDYAVVLQANGVTMKRPLRVVDMTKSPPGTVVIP